MGETWAYVTVLLVGGEECVHHNRHANELDRVARSNPHIQFFDCQGRIAERLILHQVMQALVSLWTCIDIESQAEAVCFAFFSTLPSHHRSPNPCCQHMTTLLRRMRRRGVVVYLISDCPLVLLTIYVVLLYYALKFLHCSIEGFSELFKRPRGTLSNTRPFASTDVGAFLFSESARRSTV